ncbi:putative BTB/POZ domain, NPH3 domain, NPH3/RPT2-like family protein [Helianthus annuus]|nr:BTB/POZ domain-containing protein At5g17580 [Helianthus annuus]XP_035832550.1 BTB/POZ domain-containing protein At5g17580 [Helianthus annuus]KAJ0547431.1 putative BTB/POZ domain, NPH3 domain, NPH3/RPT2-like family protein [Helianthus annuus]KAJ0553979.1 putative BTB/POZ domain, NPH3 domain, NPH3/RPT2-like family protein [Helianthus annuus]KAJ0898388.1 putative BTB/POZ domain, NPH3 domain, NPH3/RPT2-like family protein [Helianthus annuus]
MSRYSFSKDVQVIVGGTPFNLHRDLLAARSSKLCKLFKENPDEDLSHLLSDIPTSPQIFEIMARFCYNFQVNLTPENVIAVSCLACYLGMTEAHSPHNLLNQALSFFEHEVITGWNESIRSLKAIDNPTLLQQAVQLGLIDGCMDSIINKALDNPLLLGEPIKNPVLDDDESVYKPNAKRQLFVLDWKSEDLSLTSLHLQFYEPIIRGMIQCKMGSNYIASNLYQYAKRWVFLDPKETDEEDTSSSEGDCSNSKRVAIEAIERLLPHDRGVLPCALLSEMLQYATVLEASDNCRDGFEVRIGRQLDMADVNDLLIPSQGYSKEEKYDTECVRRILKHFYHNFSGKDQCGGLNLVAELVEDFLGEVANDIDLKKDSFTSLAEMSIAASEGTQRTSDGIYRAIDIYLNKHKYLTESEREEICAVLECNKLSAEACEHAAQNERLPVRVAVQVLFVGQLHLRETITKEVAAPEERSKKSEEEDDDEDEKVMGELEKMSSKVMELEKECVVMRREIQRGCYMRKSNKIEKEKTNVWREMKRKLGCISSLNRNNCHVKKKKKKVHPR